MALTGSKADAQASKLPTLTTPPRLLGRPRRNRDAGAGGGDRRAGPDRGEVGQAELSGAGHGPGPERGMPSMAVMSRMGVRSRCPRQISHDGRAVIDSR